MRPLTVVLASEALLNITADGPDARIQLPLPTRGILAFNGVELRLHNNWSEPAAAIVGRGLTVIVVESVATQPLNETVVIL